MRVALLLFSIALFCLGLSAASPAFAAGATVTITTIGTPTYSTVHAEGEVDPGGEPTLWNYEVSTDGGGTWMSTNLSGFTESAEAADGDIEGLTAGKTYQVRLVGTNFGGSFGSQVFSSEPNPMFTTESIPAPTLTIDPITSFTSTTAHLEGRIDPDPPAGDPPASDVEWQFVCSPECPGLAGGTVQGGAEGTDQIVTAEATGLEPNTEYSVSLIGRNAGEPVDVGPVTFTTAATAPIVRTLPASALRGGTEALVGGSINPRNSVTTYWIEWGSATGYDHKIPATPATAGSGNQTIYVTQRLAGLSPSTVYHARLVAESNGVVTKGADVSFGTAPASSPLQGGCLNAQLREEDASIDLPDCRAYELVTPANADGRELQAPSAPLPYNTFRTSLVAPSGASVVYATNGIPFPSPGLPGGTIDLYRAERFATGWRNVAHLTPSGEQAVLPNAGGLAEDQQYAFVQVGPGTGTEGGSLAQGGSTYLLNPDGSFEVLGAGSLGEERRAQGRYISPDGKHIIFTTGGKAGGEALGDEWCGLYTCAGTQLEPNAPPTGTAAVYERGPDGPTRVVSLLPGNQPLGAGENAEYQGTSADGATTAFKVGEALYLRIHGIRTVEVANTPVAFAGLSAGGDRLFYQSAGNVFMYNATEGDAEEIVGSGDAELVNISADGSHVFFLSESLLAGSDGTLGQHNLYVWEAGEKGVKYIATVASTDLEGQPALNTWTSVAVNPAKNEGQGPGGDSSRTTPDGSVFVFESRAHLTDYENEGHKEIYRYDARSSTLRCVSCDPTGVPATADARLESLGTGGSVFNIFGGGETMAVNNVTENGEAVFFETPAALSTDDTDGVNDIYEWEAGGGHPRVNLISSGHSVRYPEAQELAPPGPNVILGITPDGRDVVFRTYDRLLTGAGEGGVPAIYDARVGGGFPQPPAPERCAEELCQGPLSGGPSLSAPQSSVAQAHGNVVPHCPRGHKAKIGGKRKRCHRPKRRHENKHRHVRKHRHRSVDRGHGRVARFGRGVSR